MTALLKITTSSASTLGTPVEVDLTTGMNPKLQFSVTNPIIDIPVPSDDWVPGATVPFNVYTLNLGMLSGRVVISFKETSGIGTTGSGYGIAALSTVFEKMMMMAYADKGAKYLYINNTTYPWTVEITEYTATIEPGQKDIVEHNVSMLLRVPV